MAEGEEIQVLVTNLPRANEDAGNIRFGATADTVVRTYLDEYKPEHVFRLLKSGIGMDKVYLHRGSRVAAMFFIAGVAGTLLSVMDEIDTTFAREQKAQNPRISKYTKKYHR